MKYINEHWSRSKTYRSLLILAVAYALLRLAIQVFLFSDAMRPEAVAEGVQVSADLQQSYIASAQRFQAGEDLYLKGSLEQVEAHYLYSPAFAFFFRTAPTPAATDPVANHGGDPSPCLWLTLHLVGSHFRAE